MRISSGSLAMKDGRTKDALVRLLDRYGGVDPIGALERDVEVASFLAIEGLHSNLADKVAVRFGDTVKEETARRGDGDVDAVLCAHFHQHL